MHAHQATISSQCNSAADWLRPEFAVLCARFDQWTPKLHQLSNPDGASDAIAVALGDQFRQARQIADSIQNELQRFRDGSEPVAEPEDLRRLLCHGQRLTAELAVRASGLREMQQTADAVAAVCDRLLHESTVDDGSIEGLIDQLRQHADGGERPWTLWDPAFTDVSSAAVRVVREQSRATSAGMLDVGVPAGRLAVRVAKRLGLSPRETVAAVFASLFQDCGHLLLQRRGNSRELADHPRFGAALAAGMRSIPTEALAAIAGHHSAANSRQRRVDCLVAVVSACVESYLRDGTTRTESDLDLPTQSRRDFRATVVAALQAELARTAVANVDARDAVDSEPSTVIDSQQVGGAVPAPRFLQLRSHSLDRDAGGVSTVSG